MAFAKGCGGGVWGGEKFYARGHFLANLTLQLCKWLALLHVLS